MNKFTIHVHYNFYGSNFDEYVFIETETNQPTSKNIYDALKNVVDKFEDIEYISDLFEGHVKPIQYKME